MAKFKVSVEAQNDLSGIASYTEQMWGREQRNTYLAMMESAFEHLADHPSIGQACDQVRAGYCYFLVGRHLVFYRVVVGGVVEVVRVLHKSMHVGTNL